MERLSTCRSLPLRADEVRRLGPLADLKVPYRLLGNPVPLGHAPVQTQMLEPRVRQKSLDEPTLVRRVLENTPVISAVSTALARVAIERIQKRFAVLGVDTVFHRHQNRAPVGGDLVSRDRVGPLHRWGKIDIRSGL